MKAYPGSRLYPLKVSVLEGSGLAVLNPPAGLKNHAIRPDVRGE